MKEKHFSGRAHTNVCLSIPNAQKRYGEKNYDFRRVRTCATEVTGALILRLRPLGQKVRYYDE